MMSNVSASKALVFEPVGLKPAVGVLAPNYLKDPSSDEWADDAAMKEYKAQLKKYAPRLNANESFNVYGWSSAHTMVETLKKMGDDVTRERLMEVVRDLELELPLLLPGINVKTGEGDGYPIQQVQIQRFNGKSWEQAGDVFDASSDS
jgi:branched-chain amino acid transport system substrate-binding protein